MLLKKKSQKHGFYFQEGFIESKINAHSAMVLSVLLHGAAEPWALSRNQLSRLETLHNSWLRCITSDIVGRPDSISTKDLIEKTHQLHINIMIKERRLKWLRHAAVVGGMLCKSDKPSIIIII